MARSPLPARDGISAQRVVLRGVVPADREYVAARAGDSPFPEGQRLMPGTMLARPVPAWCYPDVAPEPPIPFDYTVLHADRELIVVHKPHFLPTTSNGRIVRETLQTRLRVDFGEDDIVPLHRLDRLTAGVVLCSRNPATRAAYQRLFAERAVTKTYRAQLSAPLDFQGWVEMRMHKAPGQRVVSAVDEDAYLREGIGKLTRTWVDARSDEALLRPVTGHTHQLRVVLHHLGAPIAGDDTYPVDRGLDLYDFSSPLRLVAEEITFRDPLSGNERQFSIFR